MKDAQRCRRSTQSVHTVSSLCIHHALGLTAMISNAATQVTHRGRRRICKQPKCIDRQTCIVGEEHITGP